jgi:hypothetical protein
MDEFPADPASLGPRRHALTIVIPVYNGGDELRRCLRGLGTSTRTDYELIVVDDGSTDASAPLAASFGARVLRRDHPGGPALARNDGAHVATAPIVFFLDADVVVHPDTIARAMARFEADPGLAALFGSYDDTPADPGLVSRFRNLLHHYVHQSGEFVDDARPARTFWTGCGAIRRSSFLAVGGFDPRLYRRPAIEDIELGYRLTRADQKIVLARDVLATHLKRWTLANVVRTDIVCRGVPWLLLMKRERMPETDLNVKSSQKLSVALAVLAILLVPAVSVLPVAAVAAFACVGLNGWLNRDFYRFLARRGGWGFALRALPLHYVYFVCCAVSVLVAESIWHLGLGPSEAMKAQDGATGRGETAGATMRRPHAAKARRPAAPWTRNRESRSSDPTIDEARSRKPSR